jgi:hypothetical protein
MDLTDTLFLTTTSFILFPDGVFVVPAHHTNLFYDPVVGSYRVTYDPMSNQWAHFFIPLIILLVSILESCRIPPQPL